MDFVADHVALAGAGAAILLAALAWYGDRRRLYRKNRDRVGIMPWTGLFFWALLLAVLLLSAAAQQWLAG